MIDTGSWVKDYPQTFSHWLLVGAAVLLVVLLTQRLLRRFGMKTEAATGLALIMPWVLGFLIFNLYPFIASFYLSLTEYNPLRPLSLAKLPALVGKELRICVNPGPQLLAEHPADAALWSHLDSAGFGWLSFHCHAAGSQCSWGGYLAHDLLYASCTASGSYSTFMALDVQPIQRSHQSFDQSISHSIWP